MSRNTSEQCLPSCPSVPTPALFSFSINLVSVCSMTGQGPLHHTHIYEAFKLKETAANQFPTQQMPSPNEIHTHARQDLKYAMYSTSSLLDNSIRIKGI